jgi:hypothetical protein
VRFVLDHHRRAVETSHDDRASTRQWASDEVFEDQEVIARCVVKGQRQNSRVRTKRERNFGNEVCTVLCVAVLDAPNVVADSGATRGCSPGSPVLEET